MPRTRALLPLLTLGLAALLVGCGDHPARGGGDAPLASAGGTAPLPPGEPAVEIAGAVPLEHAEPEELPGLHHVFHLSPNVISGAEPHGPEALEQLAAMGVKTIVSVDGKTPDHETAARLGMRYVHVPIQYKGITPDEIHRLAKTFRELEPPFYVHCFHGKHRGPAAAALARVILDGTDRRQAVAEMRQWCGTSPKYDGLYETIARAEVPTPAQTAAYAWDFPAEHPARGFRHAMIDLTRSWDHIKALESRGWEVDPDHPDVDPVNEAAKVVDQLEKAAAADDVAGCDEQFRAWLDESVASARTMHEALRATPRQADRAREAMARVAQACTDCHAAHRNTVE